MTAELPKTTNRQKEVLAFCIEHFTEFDCLPTLQAMADHFLWASIESSVYHFKALEKRGYLERCGHSYRFNRNWLARPAPHQLALAKHKEV